MRTPNTFPVKTPSKFPFEAGRGTARLTLYKVVKRSNGKKKRAYTEFRFMRIMDNGKPQDHYFADYPKARNWGNLMLLKLSRNEGDTIVLRGVAKDIYCRAVDFLRPTGEPLDIAVMRHIEAAKVSEGCNVPVIEMVRDYIRRHPTKLPEKPISDVVDEFIKSGEKDWSLRYVEDLRHRLGRLKQIGGNIGGIDHVQLRAFFDGLKDASAKTYNNFLRAIVTLFNYAKSKRYLPAHWDELDGIGKRPDRGGKKEIFTPEEMAALLEKAPDELIPPLAIGAFAGLRSAEINRLEWEDIRFQDGEIALGVDKTKGASCRAVPLSDNLKAWLQPHAKIRGKVWPHSQAYFYEAMEPVCKNANVEWKQNVLRHSYISYRVVDTQDVPKVAYESGNSPAMIHKHYRTLVTRKEATRWFSIKPGIAGGEKVIWLKLDAA